MSQKNVALFTCSACDYMTDNRSNMNTHIRIHDSATVNKITMTVGQFLEAHRALHADGDGHTSDGQSNVRPGPTSMKSSAMREMDAVIDMTDMDARITFFNTTVRGRSILDEIRDTSGVVNQFFVFIQHAFGIRSPPEFRSAQFVVSRKNRMYLMWKCHGLVTFKEVTDKEVFSFFWPAYKAFEHIVLEYPIKHPDVSHLRPAEARLIQREFTHVPHTLEFSRKFAFVDLLLGKVRDAYMYNPLKRFPEHHILMPIRG